MKKMALILLALLIFVPLYSLQAGGDQPTHVITMDTHYYKDGPQQARPPDGTLKAGEQVAFISSGGSYSLVQMKDGQQAYVSSSSLKSIQETK